MSWEYTDASGGSARHKKGGMMRNNSRWKALKPAFAT